MNEMQIFSNSEFGEVRVLNIEGEPWFVGIDVANNLGYQNGSRDISRHVDTEDKRKEMLSHSQNGNVVTETALINLPSYFTTELLETLM